MGPPCGLCNVQHCNMHVRTHERPATIRNMCNTPTPVLVPVPPASAWIELQRQTVKRRRHLVPMLVRAAAALRVRTHRGGACNTHVVYSS